MKKIILRMFFGLVLLTSVHHKSFAQSVGSLNITAQPLWGPVGYQNVAYYYLPDVESYYSVATHQFIYLSGGRWVYCVSLPAQYKKYDLYSGYKVIINRPRPFLNFEQDRIKYTGYKNLKNKQIAIRDAKKKDATDSHMQQSGSSKKRDTGGDFGPER